MPAIVFHTDAAEEMQAAAYYAVRAPGLGDAFLDEIEQGLRRIQGFPRLWPVYEGAYRRYLLQRFPYSLMGWRQSRVGTPPGASPTCHS
jgi:hypothetical protein